MAEFLYKTRAMTSPQGKPRVYICCHPEDFGKSFPAVSEDILTKQNCAVWYPADPFAPRTEDFLADLAQMQLFVMPVTDRLLRTENPALGAEFPFAIAHNIPVLPILLQPGLETLFNQKCGDLHLLDKYGTDATAISYEEKLEKYLSAVLIGDALAEKIRSAFDAYVFLSYRKKDRKYARELMQLIHKNDFCRDIAVWYDEFLTPGEDFNSAIRQALEKCGLFVLAVTPNLVNETNYIMTTEYPMALREGKPILPAELLPTDRDLLSEKYASIPLCTDAHNADALSAALRDTLRCVALRERETSPEHTFFIGLAYLSGVDVEVDHARAVELITTAAEAGLPEASRQLADMYETGLGVTRSYPTSLLWRETAIRQLREAFRADPSEQLYEALLEALIVCGDTYQQTGQAAKAREKYVLTQTVLSEQKDGSHKRAALCQERLADTYLSEGNLPEAKKHYTNALSLRKSIFSEIDTPQLRRDLAILHLNIGDICSACSDYFEASLQYEEALALYQTLENTAEIRHEFCLAHLRLAEVQEATGFLRQAVEIYEKILPLQMSAAEESGSCQAGSNLALIHKRLGDLYLSLGSLEKAQTHFYTALTILEKLSEESGSLDAFWNLGAIHQSLGALCEDLEDFPQAKRHYRKSLSISQTLSQQTDFAESKRDLFCAHADLGRLCQAEGEWTQARAYYEDAQRICRELVTQLDTAESKQDLAYTLEALGSLYRETGDLRRTRRFWEESYSICSALAVQTPTISVKQDFASIGCQMGSLCLQEGDMQAAKAYFSKSIHICEKLAEQSSHPKILDDLATYHYKMFCTDAGDRISHLKKAISIYDSLCRQYPEVFVYREKLEAIKPLLRH